MPKKDTPKYLLEYNILKAINQKMKEIADVYVVYNGMIEIHSLIPYIEKYAIINNGIMECYNNLSILPNELFNFTKLAKKSKLQYNETLDHVILSDNSEVTEGKEHASDIKLSKFISENNSGAIDPAIYAQHIIETITPKFYNHADILFTKDTNYVATSQDTVKMLVDNEPIIINDGLRSMTITRNLFPTLKKTDQLSYAILDKIDSDIPQKFYAIFKEQSEYITIYTLGAFITI